MWIVHIICTLFLTLSHLYNFYFLKYFILSNCLLCDFFVPCRPFPCKVNRSNISFFKAKLTKMVEFYGVFTYISARAIFCAALTIACGLLPRLSIFAIYGPCYSAGAWKHTWEMKKRVKMAFFIIKCCFCRQLTLGFFHYNCLIYRLIPEPLLNLGWQWLSTVFSLCPLFWTLKLCELF